MSVSRRILRPAVLVFAVVFAAPLAAHGAISFGKGWATSWRNADWSSTGMLPAARAHAPAMVRVLAARTGRWKGIFAVHSWIVLKAEGGPYERYEKVGWGAPIRRNARDPDGRWYGNTPEIVFAADGEVAARLIPKLRAAIDAYPFGRRGDYRVWPGPNSNTFVADVLARVPEIDAVLPPTAIGKDFPTGGRWFGVTPSGTGVWVSAGGYLGLRLGWVEGLELNVLGAVAGLDFRRPAVKVPGFGRIGV
jgi:hypothetical protein